MTFSCSHCGHTMPQNHGAFEIAVGWTVIRVEQHSAKNISIGYLYLCPDDMLETKSRQVTLGLPTLTETNSKNSVPQNPPPGENP
jgi:hypothetical protein